MYGDAEKGLAFVLPGRCWGRGAITLMPMAGAGGAPGEATPQAVPMVAATRRRNTTASTTSWLGSADLGQARTTWAGFGRSRGKLGTCGRSVFPHVGWDRPQAPAALPHTDADESPTASATMDAHRAGKRTSLRPTRADGEPAATRRLRRSASPCTPKRHRTQYVDSTALKTAGGSSTRASTPDRWHRCR